jgi:gamma-glutamyl-gamma-aminobutyrate hydrolase PuuD
MPTSIHKPVIALIRYAKIVAYYQMQSVNEFYINAITHFGGIPLLIPSTISSENLNTLSPIFDGLLLTGPHSNVDPVEYGTTHQEDKKDKARDVLAFNLINLSTLGICRSFREMNVVLGGSLKPALQIIGKGLPILTNIGKMLDNRTKKDS